MAVLADELLVCLLQWTQSQRGRVRREDVRALVAQILALVASNMPPGTLRTSTSLRARFLEFVAETTRYLAANTFAGQLACQEA